MTLQELSPQYARQAETVARRLRELRQQELAEHTAHYYDRRYIRREKYRI